MRMAWGVFVIIVSLVCWGGQGVAWIAPDTARRLGLADNPDDVDPTFELDGRGEALWDLLSLWTMVIAGVLLVVDSDWWPYFGLVGGGSYLYFAGRGIAVRSLLRRRGVHIGTPGTVKVAFTALVVWGLTACITIVAAVVTLR